MRLLDRKGRPAKLPVERAARARPAVRRRLPPLPLRPSAREVEVGVRERGRRYERDAARALGARRERRARALLRRAERTMRALRGVRELERLTSGPGTGATTEYRLRAPDRLGVEHRARGARAS